MVKKAQILLNNLSRQGLGDLSNKKSAMRPSSTPLPKGCYSAHVTDLLEAEMSLQSPERPWQPGCQTWVKEKRSNNEEQVDGEADYR